jgi:hypothetical protein
MPVKSSMVRLVAACISSMIISSTPASAQQPATHQWPILQNDGHCWIEVRPVAEVVQGPVGNTSHANHRSACGALKNEHEAVTTPDARVCKHVEPCTMRRCELDGIQIKPPDAEESIGSREHEALTAHSMPGLSCSVGG